MKQIFLLLFFIPGGSVAQELHPTDAAAQGVIFLSSEYPFTKKSKGGSASLFTDSIGNSYIVTAAHVVQDIGKFPYAIFQDTSGAAVPILLSQVAIDGNWKTHSIADLSVLKLKKALDFPVKFGCEFKHFNLSIVKNNKLQISRNTRLTVYGYPLFLGVADFAQPFEGKTLQKISPFINHSYPSSLVFTFERADLRTDQDFIALEDPIAKGFSGGPVIDLRYKIEGDMTPRPKKMEVVGFIHGTISDTTGGKFTLMTPAYYLWDLIK